MQMDTRILWERKGVDNEKNKGSFEGPRKKAKMESEISEKIHTK